MTKELKIKNFIILWLLLSSVIVYFIHIDVAIYLALLAITYQLSAIFKNKS